MTTSTAAQTIPPTAPPAGPTQASPTQASPTQASPAQGAAGGGRGRRGVTDQAADAAVDQACRMLRLPTMRSRFAEIAESAQREQLTYRGFLAELLMAERDDRDRRRSARRITAAGFPREKWLSDFD